MTRARKRPEDNQLPPRVYRTKTRFYLKTIDNVTITLAPITTSLAELWSIYEQEITLKRQQKKTFFCLWHAFIQSSDFLALSIRTQKDYAQHQKKLLAVFGEVDANKIRPEHVRMYMDKRGLQSKTQANHEMASMSRVYQWGYQRGWVTLNPCKGVSKFKMMPRKVYVTDEEYQTIYALADLPLKIAMEIAYLCAVRVSDIIKLKWSHIDDEGIFIQQGKTGVKQIKLWSSRLKTIIQFAKERMPKRPHGYLIYNSKGDPFVYRTFNGYWTEARKKASVYLQRELCCTFHDMKAKGISDFEGSSRDKQLFSGHKTESQVLIYDRKIKRSPSL